MKKLFESKVPANDRVPFWQKVAYGLGGPVEGTANWIPGQNLTPVFNIAMGMSPELLGTVLMIWRLYDAVADHAGRRGVGRGRDRHLGRNFLGHDVLGGLIKEPPAFHCARKD